MNCEVLELPVLAVEQYQLREVVRCLLHTILFNRALGHVRPRDVDSELFDLSYVQCGDPSVERTVEDKVSALCSWVEKRPGKNLTVLVSFYDKRVKQGALWFSKQEERLYWEQWRIHLDVVRPAYRGDPDPEATRRQRHTALEAALQEGLLALLAMVSDKRDHIPPVGSAEVVCFPYEITLPSDTDSPFGLDMFKRVVLNSTPPAMLS
jgi:autophagy-related protein 101